MKQDNRIVVDLNKVQWARFYYVNQYGQQVNVKPNTMTYRLRPVMDDEFMLLTYEEQKLGFSKIKAVDWLREKDYQDKWTPQLLLKVTANESLLYTNNKAKSI